MTCRMLKDDAESLLMFQYPSDIACFPQHVSKFKVLTDVEYIYKLLIPAYATGTPLPALTDHQMDFGRD